MAISKRSTGAIYAERNSSMTQSTIVLVKFYVSLKVGI